jgi:hypothetical protein
MRKGRNTDDKGATIRIPATVHDEKSCGHREGGWPSQPLLYLFSIHSLALSGQFISQILEQHQIKEISPPLAECISSGYHGIQSRRIWLAPLYNSHVGS